MILLRHASIYQIKLSTGYLDSTCPIYTLAIRGENRYSSENFRHTRIEIPESKRIGTDPENGENK